MPAETTTSNAQLFKSLFRIRLFEETVLENFPRGIFFGTTHTYLGQEADAVGILSDLQDNDIVFSNHRCHGHYLAYGGEPRALFAELMGKATGVCGGRGGSQHLHWRNFYSNGVLGGIVPVATGMALAEKRKGTRAVTIAFLGDGALGEGVVYEALNIASLWSAPILFVLENNRIAQTTPIELAVAGSLAGRFEAFGIPTITLESSDVLEILPQAQNAIREVRERQVPSAMILHTCRFGPHSKGDDTRSPDMIAELRRNCDPIAIHGNRLDSKLRSRLETEVRDEISQAFRQALDDPFPQLCEPYLDSNHIEVGASTNQQ
jgi:TPP-dependent pyruvate/acetoin dehydrogenase alpha subunit